jgi:GNAT superfamily N-acetyltransferase
VEPGIALREITDANRADVLGLAVADGQMDFVSTVAESLEEAEDSPEGNPWYRAIFAGDVPVGFVMISWDVVPDPPDILGPWMLWKLLIDARFQGKGYGRAAVDLVADIVRSEGGDRLLTSYVDGVGGPGPFYELLGFRPTGDRDGEGEIIVELVI